MDSRKIGAIIGLVLIAAACTWGLLYFVNDVLSSSAPTGFIIMMIIPVVPLTMIIVVRLIKVLIKPSEVM